MRTKVGVAKAAVRYSEAFKIQVVRELEEGGHSFRAMQRKYGVRGAGVVQQWTRKYGNGTRGKVVRVQKPEEIDELKQLKQRVRKLESALADAHLDLLIERQYVRMACQRAGIEDVEGFKKKADGTRGTGL